jgi:mannose-1-phosphate guanylyltransferase
VKVIILAGGKGTRGKPYTEFFPKAMTPIKGKPALEYIIKYLQKFAIIDEIIILTDLKGLGGQIKNYFENFKKISFVQDSGKGTGGDLLHIEKALSGETEFMLWFSDNLCAINVKEMRDNFKKSNSIAEIATRNKRKEETGFAIVENGIIKEFREIFKIIGKKIMKKQINLSYDILQPLSKKGNVSAYNIGDKQWLDVESPVIVERNEKTVLEIIKQMGF